MNPLSILALSIAMSTDAFAASVGKGAAMHNPGWGRALGTGLIFGTIEAVTPVIGWLLGVAAAAHVASWDHWIAFVLLGLLGLHMIRAGLRPETQDRGRSGEGFWHLAATGLATSIDAMALGVGLAFADVHIATVALAIGACTFVAVTLGVRLGHRLGRLVGKRAEVLGGLVLIVIGSLILHEHLTGARIVS